MEKRSSCCLVPDQPASHHRNILAIYMPSTSQSNLYHGRLVIRLQGYKKSIINSHKHEICLVIIVGILKFMTRVNESTYPAVLSK